MSTPPIKSQQDLERDKVMQELGLSEEGGPGGKPWHRAALDPIIRIRTNGGGPVVGGQAILDFVIARAIDDAIDRLVGATDALVESSDQNTEKMSSLADRLNRLTFWVAVAAGLSALAAVAIIWVALRQPPPPTVIVQPVISLPAAPSPAVSPTPSPPPSTGQPDPKSSKKHSKKDEPKKDPKKHH